MNESGNILRRRNWWKFAFFVMLFLFEGAREFVVIEANTPALIGASAMVTPLKLGDNLLVSAQGNWKRIDGGSQLGPNGVKIDCYSSEGRCHEASVTVSDNRYVSIPSQSSYPATFADDAITYQNDDPACVTYSVRIDLKLLKTFATRDRKPSSDANCSTFENRIEMQLGDGFNPIDPMKGHFVPMLSLFKAVLGS